MTVEGWRAEAACRGRPTWIWYSKAPEVQAVAVRICRGCPARAACLAEALEVEARSWRSTFGVFGGLLPHERDALRQRHTEPVPSPA